MVLPQYRDASYAKVEVYEPAADSNSSTANPGITSIKRKRKKKKKKTKEASATRDEDSFDDIEP